MIAEGDVVVVVQPIFTAHAFDQVGRLGLVLETTDVIPPTRALVMLSDSEAGLPLCIWWSTEKLESLGAL